MAYTGNIDFCWEIQCNGYPFTHVLILTADVLIYLIHFVTLDELLNIYLIRKSSILDISGTLWKHFLDTRV